MVGVNISNLSSL